MMKTKIFKCSATQRKDAANIYYINCIAATRMEETKNQTNIYNRKGNLIASFIVG